MQITRMFRNGNSVAVRIPPDLAYPDTEKEVQIERVGDELRIRPIHRRPTGTVEQFAGPDSSSVDGECT